MPKNTDEAMLSMVSSALALIEEKGRPVITDCAACIFFHEDELGDDLKRRFVCRKYPPTMALFGAPQGLIKVTSYPDVTDATGCFSGYPAPIKVNLSS